MQGEKEIAIDEHSGSVHGNRTEVYSLDLNQLEPGRGVVLLIDAEFAENASAYGNFTIEKKEADDN